VGRKIGNASVRNSGRFGVSDCRRGLMQERMAIATLQVFRMRYKAFYARFGRDPEPDEPLFFDPEQELPVAPESSVIRSQIIAAAAEAGVDSGLVLDFMREGSRQRMRENSRAQGQTWRPSVAPEVDRPAWHQPLVPEEPST